MAINDYYTLESSTIFNVSPFEEVQIDLKLKKAPTRYTTLLLGCVSYHCTPIINATIKILDLNFKPLFHTVTNKYGLYKFYNILAPGEYYVIVSSDDYITSDTKTITIKNKKICRCDFELRKNPICKNAILYGTVEDSINNKFISNTKITLLDKNSNYIVATTYTNDLGQYLIYNIIQNEYILTAEHSEYVKLKSYPILIDSPDKIQLNLYMLKNPLLENGTVSGVIKFNNNPQPHIPVFLCSIENQNTFKVINVQLTNEKGLYLFSNVLSGKYVIKAKLQNGTETEEIIDLN